LKRLSALEWRFISNPLLKEAYNQFMNEYLALGHMSKVEHSDDTIPHFYMPHHGVINEASSTTKLATIFFSFGSVAGNGRR
jgi:hypothetical protein